jgi:hypothetical protein
MKDLPELVQETLLAQHLEALQQSPEKAQVGASSGDAWRFLLRTKACFN